MKGNERSHSRDAVSIVIGNKKMCTDRHFVDQHVCISVDLKNTIEKSSLFFNYIKYEMHTYCFFAFM